MGTASLVLEGSINMKLKEELWCMFASLTCCEASRLL